MPPPEATASSAPTATSSPAPTATPSERRDIRATRLAIPSLGIDEAVQSSQAVQGTPGPLPGCPPYKYQAEFEQDGWQTVSVPEHGVATPDFPVQGATENKAWIYGHSRWQGVPNIFHRLQDINIGDEVILDGVDRNTGEQYTGLRFRVTGIYLGDMDSGTDLLNAWTPEQIPSKPEVIMQTSAREDGVGKQWLLDRETVLGKATNLVAGSIDDACKYLDLWVVAQPG